MLTCKDKRETCMKLTEEFNAQNKNETPGIVRNKEDNERKNVVPNWSIN